MRSQNLKKIISREKEARKNIESMGFLMLPSVNGPYIFDPKLSRVLIAYENGASKFYDFCGVKL